MLAGAAALKGGSFLADTLQQGRADSRQGKITDELGRTLSLNRDAAQDNFNTALGASDAGTLSSDIEGERQEFLARLTQAVMPQQATGQSTSAQNDPKVVQERRDAEAAKTAAKVKGNLASVAALRGAANAEQSSAISRGAEARAVSRLGNFSRGSAGAADSAFRASAFQRSPCLLF